MCNDSFLLAIDSLQPSNSILSIDNNSLTLLIAWFKDCICLKIAMHYVVNTDKNDQQYLLNMKIMTSGLFYTVIHSSHCFV